MRTSPATTVLQLLRLQWHKHPAESKRRGQPHRGGTYKPHSARRSHPHQQVRADRVRQRREPRVRGSPGGAEHQRQDGHHLHLRRRPDQQGALQPGRQDFLLPRRNIDFLRQCILLP